MSSLDSVRLKIDWAYKHAELLESEGRRYLNSEPNKVVGDFEPDADRHILAVRFQQTKAVPPDISLIVGDCLHNLRSALDYLVWELVLAAKNEPTTKNMFPICSTAENFAEAQKRHRLDGVPPEAVAEIELLQPFHNSNPLADPLAILDELINIDKHKRILLTACAVAAGGEAVFTDHTGAKMQTEFSAGYDGAKIASGPFLVHGEKVHMEGTYVTYIALQDGTAKDMEISQVLIELGRYTSFVVDRFSRFF